MISYNNLHVFHSQKNERSVNEFYKMYRLGAFGKYSNQNSHFINKETRLGQGNYLFKMTGHPRQNRWQNWEQLSLCVMLCPLKLLVSLKQINSALLTIWVGYFVVWNASSTPFLVVRIKNISRHCQISPAGCKISPENHCLKLNEVPEKTLRP